MLGIPDENRREVVELGNRILGSQDPEFELAPDEVDPTLPLASPVAAELLEFGRQSICYTRRAARTRATTSSHS